MKLTISHPMCVAPLEKEEPQRRPPLQIPPVPAAKQQPQATQPHITPFRPPQGRRGEPYYSNASSPRPHLPQYPASYMPPVYPQGVGPHENMQGFTPAGVPPPYHTPADQGYYPVTTSVRPTSASRLVQQTSFPPPSYVNRHHSASNIQQRRPDPPAQPPQLYPPPPSHHGYHGDTRSPATSVQPPSHPQQGYPHATGFHRYLGGVSDAKGQPFPTSRPTGNTRSVTRTYTNALVVGVHIHTDAAQNIVNLSTHGDTSCLPHASSTTRYFEGCYMLHWVGDCLPCPLLTMY